MAVPDPRGARAICVLIPVHDATQAPHLALALDSIEAQTLRPGQVLVVEDGPLTPAHDQVLAAASSRMPELTVLRPGQVGLVGALNVGLAHTNSPWVARMDGDDVAEPERLARQAEAAGRGGVTVVGTAMREFRDHPDRAAVVRRVPTEHEAIVRAMRSLNPVNHPTVLVRRDAVLAVGGYEPIAGLEDYWLWARMAAAGARFRNLPEPLVRFRADDGLYRRRADRAALRAEVDLQRRLVRLGLVSRPRAAVNVVVRCGFRLLPAKPMRWAYVVLRRLLGRGADAH